MVVEIVPGIHQLSFKSEGNGTTSVYVLEGPDGLVLVDTGWDAPGALDSLMSQFAQAGLDPAGIRCMVLTHAHTDHVGLACNFKKLSGASVIMHPIEAELMPDLLVDEAERLGKREDRWLHKAGSPKLETDELRKSFIQTRKRIDCVPSVDRLVNDGDNIANGRFELRVLLTPGHSVGHICLFEPNRKILFAGDHLIAKTMTYVGSGLRHSPNPAGDFVNSLVKVLDLDVDLVCPAHGHPFTGFKNRVTQLLTESDEMQADILRALSCVPATAYSVASSLTCMKERGSRPFEKLKHTEKRKALSDTVSQLELLRFNGKVVQAPQNGHMAYVLAGC